MWLEAMASLFLLIGLVWLWFWPADDDYTLWGDPNMKRWRDWRTWWRR